MNLLELQILFQQKIEDVSPVFRESDKPDTFTIAVYLNKAVDQYLFNKYLSLPTFEQRLVAIDMNFDALSKLAVANKSVSAANDYSTNYPWGSAGERYVVPDDILIPYSISCLVTRTEVYPLSNERVFVRFVSRKQAERLISNSYDKTMFPHPVCVWENPGYIILVGDGYTSGISAPMISYIRKPHRLSYDYVEYEGTGVGNADITDIPNDLYFTAKSSFEYVGENYDYGDKVKKQAGYNDAEYTGEKVLVGYPYGKTDKPDFPEYMHENICELAVSLFLDQAKFKLISKSQTEGQLS